MGPAGVVPLDDELLDDMLGWIAPPMDDVGLGVPEAEDDELLPP